jgi:hypothetical protein
MSKFQHQTKLYSKYSTLPLSFLSDYQATRLNTTEPGTLNLDTVLSSAIGCQFVDLIFLFFLMWYSMRFRLKSDAKNINLLAYEYDS